MLTADRIALLVSLVPYLASASRPIPVPEAAAHFEVSAPEIREAVELIAVSGAPGTDGTYQHAELFDIDWEALETRDEIVITHVVAFERAPVLSGPETQALLAGVQALAQSVDPELRATAERLAAKLRHTPHATIAVDPRPADETLEVLRDAVRAKRVVEFEYRSPGSGDTRRRVDPLRLESLGDDWYLRAWCHEREAPRSFRLDRLRALLVTDDTAASHADPGDEPIFVATPHHGAVTLEIEAEAFPAVRDFLAADARVPKPDRTGRRRLEIRVGGWDILVRLVTGHASRIRVLAPAAARDAVAAWAAAGLER